MKRVNHLAILLELYPGEPWNYIWLSINPNVTWEIVRDHPDRPWDYRGLSRNPNITWKIVRDNPDKPWDYGMLSRNIFECDATVWRRKQTHAKIQEKIPLPRNLAKIVADYAI